MPAVSHHHQNSTYVGEVKEHTFVFDSARAQNVLRVCEAFRVVDGGEESTDSISGGDQKIKGGLMRQLPFSERIPATVRLFPF